MALILRGPGAEVPLRDGLVIGRKTVGLTDIKISRNHLQVVQEAVTGRFFVRRQKSNPTRLRRADAGAGDEVAVGAEPVELLAGDRIWIQNRMSPPEPLEEADPARILEVVEATAHAHDSNSLHQSNALHVSAAEGLGADRSGVRQSALERPVAGSRRARSPEHSVAQEPPTKRRVASTDAPELSAASGGACGYGNRTSASSARTDDRDADIDKIQFNSSSKQLQAHDLAVLVMVGIPGVGKTTFIEKLIGSCGSVTWVRCSQDDEGSREKCLKKARKALSDDASVAIDRTDVDATQRKHWIDLAREFGAHALVLTLRLDTDTCICRAEQRTGHPSDQKSAGGKASWKGICGMMERQYRPVDTTEGFDWRYSCEGQGENDASYNSALTNVMLALKDCTAPNLLEQRLHSMSASSASRLSSEVSDRSGAMSAVVRTTVDVPSRPLQVEPISDGRSLASGVADSAVIQEAWQTRHQWAPVSASGLNCHDNPADVPALWCSLVAQRANLLYQQRAGTGDTRAQQFPEVEVFGCLTKLVQSAATNSDSAQQQVQQQRSGSDTKGSENKNNWGGAATAGALEPTSRDKVALPEQAVNGVHARSSASDYTGLEGLAAGETGPVVLESSPNGDWTLAFPVFGTGYFGWVAGEAVRVLLASVATFLRDCRAAKLRLAMVVPQPGDEVMAYVKKERERSARVANLDGRFEIVRGEMDQLDTSKSRTIAIACNRRFKAPSGDACAKRVHERCAVPPGGKKTLELQAGEQAKHRTFGRSTTADVGGVYSVLLSRDSELNEKQGIDRVVMVRPPNLNPDNPNCESSLSEAKERLHGMYMELFRSHVAYCDERRAV